LRGIGFIGIEQAGTVGDAVQFFKALDSFEEYGILLFEMSLKMFQASLDESSCRVHELLLMAEKGC
jgi:hypothetical protein